jgi:hypothetical protein
MFRSDIKFVVSPSDVGFYLLYFYCLAFFVSNEHVLFVDFFVQWHLFLCPSNLHRLQKFFLLLPLVPSFAETAFLSIPPTLPTTNDLIPPKGSVACEGRSLAQGLKQRRFELTMETFILGYSDHGYNEFTVIANNFDLLV